MKPWPTVRLGEVLTPTVRGESVDASKEYRLLGIRLDGQGPFLRETVMGTQTSATKLFRVAENDFIYSRLFACRGAFGVISKELDGCFVSSEFPAFIPVPGKIDVEYLKYWFRLPSVIATVDADCSGSTPLTRNRFKENFFLALEFPLPPLAEQRRVVARIEALAAQIHEARTLRHQAAEEAEALIRVHRSRLIQDNPSANRVRFEELATETQLGLDRGTSQQSPEYPTAYLKMNNITSRGTTDLAGVTRVHASDEEIKKYALKTGDFLFNTRNSFELVGKTAIWECADEPFVFNNNIMRIRFRDDVEPRFVNAAFISPVVADQLLQFKKQTTSVCALYWKNLKEVLVPVPPLAEQRRIVAELDALQAEVDTLKRLQAETAAELDALLPALLDRAFKGEL
jgi:type I restriction enzyme S subunit